MKRPIHFRKGFLSPLFLNAHTQKNPLKSLPFLWREPSCVAALFYSTQLAAPSQTKSLLMQGKGVRRLDPTQETIRSLQRRQIPQHIPRQGCCKRGIAQPVLKGSYVWPCLCLAFVFFDPLILSTFSCLLDSFADAPPPSHDRCFCAFLLLLFYALLSVQIHIFKQAK